jgi:phage-related tail protein
MALGIIPSALDLAAKAFTDLNADLDKEKAAWLTTQIEVDVLTRVVMDLKISVDRFASQVPTLEDKVKHLENKVVDGIIEIMARELYLERTTRANNDYQKQITQLAKKLERKSFGHL